MQIKIQFGSPSTFQEWSHFKGILSQGKIKEEPLIKNGTNAENLVLHLSRQLETGRAMAVVEEVVPPIFPEKHFLGLVA